MFSLFREFSVLENYWKLSSNLKRIYRFPIIKFLFKPNHLQKKPFKTISLCQQFFDHKINPKRKKAGKIIHGRLTQSTLWENKYRFKSQRHRQISCNDSITNNKCSMNNLFSTVQIVQLYLQSTLNQAC